MYMSYCVNNADICFSVVNEGQWSLGHVLHSTKLGTDEYQSLFNSKLQGIDLAIYTSFSIVLIILCRFLFNPTWFTTNQFLCQR